LGDKDGRMDAMKSSGAFPPDETAEEAPAAANATLVVEDLLDLKEFKILTKMSPRTRIRWHRWSPPWPRRRRRRRPQ
jgi:hypothetical protein